MCVSVHSSHHLTPTQINVTLAAFGRYGMSSTPVNAFSHPLHRDEPITDHDSQHLNIMTKTLQWSNLTVILFEQHMRFALPNTTN